jgi:hypothetical protein
MTKLALEAPSFGQGKKIDLPIYEKSGKQNGTITTYHLTAKQSIACGAKLDNGFLMEVIDIKFSCTRYNLSKK